MNVSESDYLDGGNRAIRMIDAAKDPNSAASDFLDAFGRVRVVQPTTLFDTVLQYDRNSWSSTLFGDWEEYGTGTYQFNHLPDESACELQIGTASGDKAVRQQHLFNRYQPGKGQEISQTYNPVIKDNVVNRIEYGDDDDGLTLEIKTVAGVTTISTIIRSSVSGSPVEIVRSQAEWISSDKLDGTGESGLTLDITKAQIFTVDLEWLSLGRVRFGFYLNGRPIYADKRGNVNELNSAYMKTANLPVRLSIENIGITSGISKLKQICTSVVSSGGFEVERGINSVFSNGSAGVTVDTTFRPIINIRPRAQINSINNTGLLQIVNYAIECATNDIEYRLYLNPTLTGGSAETFATQPNGKMIEYGILQTGTAVSISNGTIEDIGRAKAGQGAQPGSLSSAALEYGHQILLARNHDFTLADTITLAAKADTGTAVVKVTGLCREFW